MQFVGFLIALVLLVAMFSWLRSSGGESLQGIKNVLTFSSSTRSSYSTGTAEREEPRVIAPAPQPEPVTISSGRSPYADRIVIQAVTIGSWSAMLIVATSESGNVGVGGWKIVSARGAFGMPAGVRQNQGAEGAIIFAPGESIAVFEGARDERMRQLFPDASWYAWMGRSFLNDHDTIILYDSAGKIVSRYAY